MESISTEDLNGEGTEDNPYKISTIEELQSIPNSTQSYFEQVADIDASATQDWDDGAGFLPIGQNMTTFFEGVYDGNGYIIQDLHIDLAKRDWEEVYGDNTVNAQAGLFGKFGGEIKDVHLRDVNVKAKKENGNAGGLIGDTCNPGDSNRPINVYRCSVTGKIHAPDSTGSAGGISAGYHFNKISESFFEGTVIAGGAVGGLVSFANEITDCYTKATVTSRHSSGGLLVNNSDKITRSYAVGEVDYNSSETSQESSPGGLVKTHPNTPVNAENAYFIITESVEEDKNRGFFSKLLGLGGDDVHDDLNVATPISSEAAKGETAPENFDGFDFEKIWKTKAGEYPMLHWQG